MTQKYSTCKQRNLKIPHKTLVNIKGLTVAYERNRTHNYL